MRSATTVTLSVLFFVDRALNIKFLQDLGRAFAYTSQVLPSVRLLVFDNGVSRNADEAERTREQVEICGKLLGWPSTYRASGHNAGIGEAHNENFAHDRSDIFLTVNNNVSFPDLDFIARIVGVFDTDAEVAAVGAIDSPHAFTDDWGRASLPDSCQALELDYLEGSILAIRTQALQSLGGLFSPRFAHFYFEDMDLSFRLRLNGWRLKAIRIPHLHERTPPAKSFPRAILNSITEQNRAIFLFLWGRDLQRKCFTRSVYFEICSVGMGDNLLASFIAIEEITRLRREGFSRIVIYLRTHGLAFLFDGISGVELIADEADPVEVFDRVYSLSDIDYTSTLSLFDNIGVSWSFLPSWEAAQARALQVAQSSPGAGLIDLPGRYCVLHMPQPRPNWEGRYPSAVFSQTTVQACVEQGLSVVLIGDSTDEAVIEPEHGALFDRRGALSIQQLFGIISRAECYFGPDSGPMHVAQLLNCRSFVFFGATLAASRVRESSRTWPYRVDGPTCHGCYHDYPGLGFNRCVRLDQSCMIDIETTPLRDAMALFLKGAAPDWSAENRHHRRVLWRLATLGRSRRSQGDSSFKIDSLSIPYMASRPQRGLPPVPVGRTLHDHNRAQELARLREELRTLKGDSLSASLSFKAGSRPDAKAGAFQAVASVGGKEWIARDIPWKLSNVELSWNGTHSAFCTSSTTDPRMVFRLPVEEPLMSGFQRLELSFILLSRVHTRTILFWTSDLMEGFNPGKSMVIKTPAGLTPVRFLVSGATIVSMRLDPVEYAGEFYIENLTVAAWKERGGSE